MGQALYRRYRSKNLAEIVGQEHITQTLGNALKQGSVGHAYLLTGPRGVGKTSIARILAHEINELPYEKEQVHLDIIEIDAASNRRIDEIRDLRDKVHIAPTSARYKVYIIDEVHMLTKEAFNALLKTLEEPPAHVIFILATTDVHKLPDTIISRTQHFTFKPISVDKIVAHLKTITKTEKITIDEAALKLIATHGGGSFRDSIGLLEQARGLGDKVTEELVRDMLGVPPDEIISKLLDAFTSQDMPQVIAQLRQLIEQGFLAEEISSQLSAQIRKSIIEGGATAQLLATLKALIDVPASREPESLLEVTLLSHMTPGTSTLTAAAKSSKQPDSKPTQPKPEMLKQPKVETKAASMPSAESITETAEKIKPEKVDLKYAPKEDESNTDEIKTAITDQDNQTTDGFVDESVWNAALSRLKKSHSTLYSVARMAEFYSDGQNITLSFKFAFHKKRMESTKHKTILSELLADITGSAPILTCIIDEKQATKPAAKANPKPKNDSLSDISNIFGGAEVLES